MAAIPSTSSPVGGGSRRTSPTPRTRKLSEMTAPARRPPRRRAAGSASQSSSSAGVLTSASSPGSLAPGPKDAAREDDPDHGPDGQRAEVAPGDPRARDPRVERVLQPGRDVLEREDPGHRVEPGGHVALRAPDAGDERERQDDHV